MYKVAHYSLYILILIKLSQYAVVIQCDYSPLHPCTLAPHPLFCLSRSPP